MFANALDAWKTLDPPSWILAAVAFAVLVMPGGIPLTAALFPIYASRRRAALKDALS